MMIMKKKNEKWKTKNEEDERGKGQQLDINEV